MKKTNFKQPASAAALDDWVNQDEPAPKAAKPAETDEKPARLTLDLPSDLHARFKSACALRKTKMQVELRNFVEEWTQKNS